MKIIHITPYFQPNIGGIETYVYELTKRLSRYCDVEVFTCGGGFTEEVAGVIVHRLRAIDIKDMPFHLKIPYPIPPTLLFHIATSDADKFKPTKVKGRYVTFIAARLVKLKGDEVFVRAVPHVLKEIRNAEFRVIGGGCRREYLKKLAKKAGVLDKIDFMGPIPYDEVPKYLAEANVVVCPGAPAGLILLEAAAMRKPIITVPHKWSVESLGETAFYTPPGNPKRLAEKIIYALKNPDVSEKMAEAAYKKVISERSWEKVVSAHLKIYRELLRRCGCV